MKVIFDRTTLTIIDRKGTLMWEHEAEIDSNGTEMWEQEAEKDSDNLTQPQLDSDNDAPPRGSVKNKAGKGKKANKPKKKKNRKNKKKEFGNVDNYFEYECEEDNSMSNSIVTPPRKARKVAPKSTFVQNMLEQVTNSTLTDLLADKQDLPRDSYLDEDDAVDDYEHLLHNEEDDTYHQEPDGAQAPTATAHARVSARDTENAARVVIYAHPDDNIDAFDSGLPAVNVLETIYASVGFSEAIEAYCGEALRNVGVSYVYNGSDLWNYDVGNFPDALYKGRINLVGVPVALLDVKSNLYPLSRKAMFNQFGEVKDVFVTEHRFKRSTTRDYVGREVRDLHSWLTCGLWIPTSFIVEKEHVGSHYDALRNLYGLSRRYKVPIVIYRDLVLLKLRIVSPYLKAFKDIVKGTPFTNAIKAGHLPVVLFKNLIFQESSIDGWTLSTTTMEPKTWIQSVGVVPSENPTPLSFQPKKERSKPSVPEWL